MVYVISLTFSGDVHAPKLYCTHYLPPHVPIAVHEHSWQVPVRVVRDACGRDALQELGGWEFGGELRQMLVQQGTEWYTEGRGVTVTRYRGCYTCLISKGKH